MGDMPPDLARLLLAYGRPPGRDPHDVVIPEPWTPTEDWNADE